jgi:hypothetical protein
VAKQWLGRDTSLWLSHSNAHCDTENQSASLESAGIEEDCDVRAMRVLPNHCMPVARTLVVCAHIKWRAGSFMCFHVVLEDVYHYFLPPSSSLPSFVHLFCPDVNNLYNRFFWRMEADKYWEQVSMWLVKRFVFIVSVSKLWREFKYHVCPQGRCILKFGELLGY